MLILYSPVLGTEFAGYMAEEPELFQNVWEGRRLRQHLSL